MTNFQELLRTRKFWTPIITFITTLIVAFAPDIIPGLEITPEIEGVIVSALWAIAGLIVAGDVGFDWINAARAKE